MLKKFIVNKDYHNSRFDRWFKQNIHQVPQSFIEKLIRKKNVKVIDILKNTKFFEHTKPYVVHRLDKETSGVMIVAKNREYAQLFTSLFRIRKIHKT